MQAIARVNRVFKDEPGGLVVDYLRLADQLKKALTDYTESGGKGKPVFDQEEAVGKMQELFEVCSGMFNGFDYSQFKTGTALQRKGCAIRRGWVQERTEDSRRGRRPVARPSSHAREVFRPFVLFESARPLEVFRLIRTSRRRAVSNFRVR